MSITTSLYTGANGLGAHGDGISIVGDNIANVSTVGYKATRTVFNDVLGATGPGGVRLGAGVRMGGLQTDFRQGTFVSTGGALDLAISGRGLFVLRDAVGAELYSRDGRLSLNKDGLLVNSNGLMVQGYTISADGITAVAPSNLVLGAAQSPPSATTEANIAVNLSADATVPTTAWPDTTTAITDPNTLANASNFATSMTLYDSQGAAHRVDVYFRKTAANTWDWHAVGSSSEVTTPAALAGAVLTEIGDGTLTFDSEGQMVSQDGSIAVTFGNAADQTISMSFGDPTADGGTGLAGSTQFSGASNVTSIDQDGFSSGALVDLVVAEDGTITGMFSNGQQRTIARVVLATFASEQGLRRAGDGLWTQSLESGQPLVAAASTGGRGTVTSGNLENSNVDLGNELVTLIAYQRAFQANVRTITTADEMLAEVANLKR